MPWPRRSSHDARRFSAPVRSSPAPRIIVAMMLITALPEKPPKISSGAIRPVMPSTTSTTSATRSARMRSNRNIAIVKPTSPRTSFMSLVSVSALSITAGGNREWGIGNRRGRPGSAAHYKQEDVDGSSHPFPIPRSPFPSCRRQDPTRHGPASGRGSRNASAGASRGAARCRAGRRG